MHRSVKWDGAFIVAVLAVDLEHVSTANYDFSVSRRKRCVIYWCPIIKIAG
jgi:hypothetical protein